MKVAMESLEQREKRLNWYHEYYLKNIDKIKEKNMNYHRKHRSKIIKRLRKYYEDNKEEMNKYHRGQTAKIKLEVLLYYSRNKNKPICARCNWDDIRALSIDHIKGGGNKHFKTINKFGNSFYRWIISQGYPKGFQVLCMNHQWVKRSENGEVHK